MLSVEWKVRSDFGFSLNIQGWVKRSAYRQVRQVRQVKKEREEMLGKLDERFCAKISDEI